jgi:hypothetical protein
MCVARRPVKEQDFLEPTMPHQHVGPPQVDVVLVLRVVVSDENLQIGES